MHSITNTQFSLFALTMFALLCLLSVAPLATATTTATTSANTAEPATVSTADTVITTGDAQATALTENDINTTVVTTASSTLPIATSSASDSLATTTVSSAPTATTSPPAPLTVTSSSTASTTANTDLSADTGGNGAMSSGDTQITTGEGVGYARVFNQLNSQFINSSGAVLFLNNLFGSIGAIDLRSLPPLAASSGSGAETAQCSDCDRQTDIAASSSATITNAVTVRSNTGGNSASGDGAHITTGDSFAAADVVNVANTTVVNGGYLLLSFQNFGNWAGDLVFPARDTLAGLFSTAVSSALFANDASIDNRVSVRADTGGNSAAGDAATTTTGTASSHATVLNQANTTLVNNDQFAVAIRVHGNWAGEIFNAPDNLVWNQSETGLSLFTLGAAGPGGGVAQGGDVSVDSRSQAEVTNDLSVTSLTGDNHATGTRAAEVTTGHAYAGANVINVVNTNVVGRNMLLAVLNIFGDWDGNVSFGQPDLWIGGVADTASDPDLPAGAQFTITYDIINRGDATAHDVAVAVTPDEGVLLATAGTTTGPLPTVLTVPELAAGASTQLTIRASVADDIADENVPAELTAEVSLHETDGNPEDNREVIAVTLNQQGQSSPSGRALPARSVTRSGADLSATAVADSSQLVVTKESGGIERTATSTLIDYTVTARNQSEERLENGEVVDVMETAAGTPLHVERWELGTVFPGEEIVITYTSAVSSDITESVKNSAVMRATLPDSSTQITSNTATTSTALGTVLGAQTTAVAVCTPYLDTYIRAGGENDPAAVRKLQQFLIEHEDATYLRPTGQLNTLTDIAIRRFQYKYAAEVLAPWGLSVATGNVMQTTTAKINDIACGDAIAYGRLDELRRSLRRLSAMAARLPDRVDDPSLLAADTASTKDK